MPNNSGLQLDVVVPVDVCENPRRKFRITTRAFCASTESFCTGVESFGAGAEKSVPVPNFIKGGGVMLRVVYISGDMYIFALGRLIITLESL